eukprot:368309-Prymnesium_polylepis.1
MFHDLAFVPLYVGARSIPKHFRTKSGAYAAKATPSPQVRYNCESLAADTALSGGASRGAT